MDYRDKCSKQNFEIHYSFWKNVNALLKLISGCDVSCRKVILIIYLLFVCLSFSRHGFPAAME